MIYLGFGSSICCCRIWASWRYGLVRLAIVVGLVSNPMYFCTRERARASSGFREAKVEILALESVVELKELKEPEVDIDVALLVKDVFEPVAAIGNDMLSAGERLGSGRAMVTD